VSWLAQEEEKQVLMEPDGLGAEANQQLVRDPNWWTNWCTSTLVLLLLLSLFSSEQVHQHAHVDVLFRVLFGPRFPWSGLSTCGSETGRAAAPTPRLGPSTGCSSRVRGREGGRGRGKGRMSGRGLQGEMEIPGWSDWDQSLPLHVLTMKPQWLTLQYCSHTSHLFNIVKGLRALIRQWNAV